MVLVLVFIFIVSLIFVIPLVFVTTVTIIFVFIFVSAVFFFRGIPVVLEISLRLVLLTFCTARHNRAQVFFSLFSVAHDSFAELSPVLGCAAVR